MQIPLLNSQNQVTLVEVKDIIFTEVKKRKLVYHTKDSFFYPIDTLKSARKLLKAYGFEDINHEQVAQLDMIVAYHPCRNEAVFIGGKTCPVSIRKKGKLNKLLNKKTQ